MRLICEGICNGGQVQEFDAAVRERKLTGYWLTVCRAFRYTVHVASGRLDHMKCVECGTERRYGRSLHGWSQ